MTLAREDELADRRRRARKEQAEIKPLPRHGGPPLFRVAGNTPDATYTVVLRGARAELGSCTCPDFIKNELATCKHIERTKNWFARKRKRLPKHLLSLWWRPREWQREPPQPLREIRLDVPEGLATHESVSHYFDADGWLRQAPAAREESAWVREAIDAVRHRAEEVGGHFDLDPAVDHRIEETLQQERREQLLQAVEIGNTAWNEIVPQLGFRLHRYQQHGVWFLARGGRAFLADDMGLGKTIQAVAAALLLRRAAGVRRMLVVCPASLKHQWGQEIERACGERAIVLEVGQAERDAAYRSWRAGSSC